MCIYLYIYIQRLASLQVRWEGAVENIYICLFQWIDWPQFQRNDMGRTLVRVMKVNASYWLQKSLLASEMAYSALGNGQIIFQTFLGGAMLNHLKWANIPLLLKSFLRHWWGEDFITTFHGWHWEVAELQCLIRIPIRIQGRLLRGDYEAHHHHPLVIALLRSYFLGEGGNPFDSHDDLGSSKASHRLSRSNSP